MSEMSENKNDNGVLLVDDLAEVVLRPPKLEWDRILDLLLGGHNVFLPIGRKKASYGRITIKRLLEKREVDKDLFSDPVIFNDKEGYIFTLNELSKSKSE